ncbi:hypothetical protein D3C81_1680200 [compost metagenome]
MGARHVIDTNGRSFGDLMVAADQDYRQIQLCPGRIRKGDPLRFHGHDAVDLQIAERRSKQLACLVHQCRLPQEIGHIQVPARQNTV